MHTLHEAHRVTARESFLTRSFARRAHENTTNMHDHVQRGRVFGIPCPFTLHVINYTLQHAYPLAPLPKHSFTYAYVRVPYEHAFSHSLNSIHVNMHNSNSHSTDGVRSNMQHAICMDASYELLKGKRGGLCIWVCQDHRQRKIHTYTN